MKGCMLPRRCLPSWLGRQLHANGGGGLAGVGLLVAPLSPSARALPGGLARVLSGGPARVLSRRAVIPSKDPAGGLVGSLGKNLVEDHCLPIFI